MEVISTTDPSILYPKILQNPCLPDYKEKQVTNIQWGLGLNNLVENKLPYLGNCREMRLERPSHTGKLNLLSEINWRFGNKVSPEC